MKKPYWPSIKLNVSIIAMLLTLLFLPILVLGQVNNTIDPATPKKVERRACKRAAAGLENLNLTEIEKKVLKDELLLFRTAQDNLKAAKIESLIKLGTAMYRISPEFAEEEVRTSYQSFADVDVERVVAKALMMHNLSQEWPKSKYTKLVKIQRDLFLCSVGRSTLLKKYVLSTILN